MVTYKGGSCERCGYRACLAALGFHHRMEKRFSLGGGHGRSWPTIRAELDTCALVCLNCHAEIHDEVARSGVTVWNRKKVEAPLAASGRIHTCTRCGRQFGYDFRKGHTRKICNSCRSNAGGGPAREMLKRRMVEYKGGRCELCGYARCLRALCFHHLDQDAKRFTIAGSHLRRWALSAASSTCAPWYATTAMRGSMTRAIR